MAQSKNKKRRSRKRARTGPSGSAQEAGADAAPRPARPTVTKAERAQKARAAKQAAVPKTMRADRGEAPLPIWAPLPITEGLILVGLLMAVAGLVAQSTGLLLGGLALVIISSLELAVREHLAGYKSHSSLIAGVSALVVGVGSSVLLNVTDVGLPQWPLLLVAALVFAAMFRAMRRVFRTRSGGLAFRI